MSNLSSSSTGKTSTEKIVGIPAACWCGGPVVIQLSRSDRNPYRRFYRCSTATFNRLVDDDHIFKWVDEAMTDEVETLRSRVAQVEINQQVMESVQQNRVEKIEIALEKKYQNWGFKATIVGVGFGVVIAGLVMKLVS